MDTVAYSRLLVKFDEDLMRIAEGAEAAADDDLEGEAREQAIARARAKLAEHDLVDAQLGADSPTLQAQFRAHFAFHVDLIRDSLASIDAAGAP